MSSEELIRRVQRAYPQIWHHCHTGHPGRDSELSARESTVLSHLASGGFPTPTELATHLGIGASTLSEAVDRLVRRGLAARAPDPDDGRRVRYRVTEAGDDALDASSVLSKRRLEGVMRMLDEADRERAVAGLELLAAACKASAQAQGDRS